MGTDCEGQGSGWGTIADIRLRVLLLSSAERGSSALEAIRVRHDVTPLELRGLWKAFRAAKVAHAVQPNLVHAIGVLGAASALGVIARGMNVPSVVSLSQEDLAHGSVTRVANAASAVLVESGELADALRSRNVLRDLYVLPVPRQSDDAAMFLGALEVVYGRVLAGASLPDAEPAADPEPRPNNDLVQLRRVKSASP